MKRRTFLKTAGGVIVLAGTGYYLASDKSNYERAPKPTASSKATSLSTDEQRILYLASLAPSGHNTQPWRVERTAPFHWTVCNDRSRWLPAVDPTQRETVLSLGAFLQTLELAAGALGYACQFSLLAATNQDERLMTVTLTKANASHFDTQKIVTRRTLRSGHLPDKLKSDDVRFLTAEAAGFIHYFSNDSKENRWLNEQTIEANRIQSFRDDAQHEQSEWMRFSTTTAKQHMDGLTTASMEIEGFSGWALRNFYGKDDVMKKGFLEKGIDKVVAQVKQSAGWLVITSKDNSVESLVETGRRLQRLWLNLRERNIAVHPMTQILEESATQKAVGSSIGLDGNIQFLLRTGYVKDYPPPVSLRRPVEWFVKTA